MSFPEIIQLIERNLATIDQKDSTVEIGFFGGSFTCLETDHQKRYLGLVQPFLADGRISSIRLSTRPDHIDKKVLELLKDMHVKTIELGVQSMNDDVLTASGRGHTAKDVTQASGLIKMHGFDLGLQMMVGLPDDDAKKSLETAEKIVDLNPDCVRIYPTLVIQNTELETLFLNGAYKPLGLDEAVACVAPILKLFLDNEINVIRVGLHPSEEFEAGGKLIAGPYHPSFRELVMTKLWYEEFLKIQKKENEDITITVPTIQYNYAIGYKAYNRDYLKLHFNRVRFQRSEVLTNFSYHVDYC